MTGAYASASVPITSGMIVLGEEVERLVRFLAGLESLEEQDEDEEDHLLQLHWCDGDWRGEG